MSKYHKTEQNMLNRELLQLNNSMNSVSEGLKALEFSKNFILAMLQLRNRLQQCLMGWII